MGVAISSLEATPMTVVTRILSAIEQGDPSAAEQLLPPVITPVSRLTRCTNRAPTPLEGVMTRGRWMLPMILVATAIFACSPSAALEARTDEPGQAPGTSNDMVLFQKKHGPKRGYHNLMIVGREFDDFVFEAQVRCLPGVTHCGLVLRQQDAKNFYRLVLRPTNRDFRVEKVVNGESDYATTGHIEFPLHHNRWYQIRLVARGDRVEVWLDGERKFRRDGFSEYLRGRAGVTAVDQAFPEFDNVRIHAADGGSVLFEDDFDDGRLDDWEIVGPEGVRGEWAVHAKVERQEARKDFVEHYTYRAVESLGRTHDLLDFPSIMKLRSGELLSVFIEELQHGTPPWAAQPASGKLWMTSSTDWGRSWSEPAPFLDTPLDDRHCYTLQLADGDLAAFWWGQPVAFGVAGIFNFTSRSKDGGRTWSDPVRVRNGKSAPPGTRVPGIRGGFSLTVPPTELPDGSMVMPIHSLGSVERALPEIGILRSYDGGRTWGDYSTIAYDPEGRISYVEPAVARLRSGKWIAVTRTEIPVYPDRTHPYKLGPTLTCNSTDEGRTWTKPCKLPLDFTWRGSTAPFLLQTESGVVIFAVNTGIAFSYDDGQTWVPQTVNCGYYPNLLEVTPNTIGTLAAGMQGRVFSLTEPAEGAVPPDGRPTPRAAPVKTPDRHAMQVVTDGLAEALDWELCEPLGMFRAIRVRGRRDRCTSPLLAQPNWPLLAVARAAAGGNAAIAGVLRSPRGEWSNPFILAKADGIQGDPVLTQAADGTLLCTFSVGTPAAPRMMMTTSHDGGATWSRPNRMGLAGETEHGFLATSPPVENADGAWFVAGLSGPNLATAAAGIFRSGDNGKTWQRVADCPKSESDAKRLIEPSLAVGRDGRWIVLARQVDSAGSGNDLIVTISHDLGRSWGTPRVTQLKGTRPEIVELFENLFFAVTERGDGRLSTAFAWDELPHFQVKPLASGYCVGFGARKHLARGGGADVAGEYNNLEQVPLSPEETHQALAEATLRLPASDDVFKFKGQWETRDATHVSSDQQASLEIEFDGPIAVLVHDRALQGRLVRVSIDGREYPPVDMSGKTESDVRTCLAVSLKQGRHKLRLWPLLAWRQGTMLVKALDVVAGTE